MSQQLEVKTTITVRFWNEQKSVPDADRTQLEDAGREHALEMMANGYSCGELNETVNDTDYLGWFEIGTETIS